MYPHSIEKHLENRNNIILEFLQIKSYILHNDEIMNAIQYMLHNMSYKCCRRPAFLAPSIVDVGTSRSSVRIARPTTTDEDNVGSFGLKELDVRRTESGEGLPLPAASGQQRTSSPTCASSVSTSDSTSFRLVDIIL